MSDYYLNAIIIQTDKNISITSNIDEEIQKINKFAITIGFLQKK